MLLDVVNDPLGLAQFVTQHRGENAISYLLAIEGISIDEWKAAKALLADVVQSNRHTKEGYIKDVVNCFINNDIETRYLVANLALCPGFQREALELATYSAGTLHAVKYIAKNIVANSEKQCVETRSEGSVSNLEKSTSNCKDLLRSRRQ